MSTKILVIDLETTIYNNGSFSDPRNSVYFIGAFDGKNTFGFYPQHDPGWKDKLQQTIDSYDLLVGHNIKFDLHWLSKLGITYTTHSIRDTSVIEYIIQKQNIKFPSLNYCAETRLNKKKLDTVQLEYWDQGINTDLVPMELLEEYCLKDCILTYEVYQSQLKDVEPHQTALISISCQDILVLLEMEQNGMKYDRESSLKQAADLEKRIEEIQEKLNIHHNNVPNFNWASNDHLSCLLYGGCIRDVVYIPKGIYKTGERKGQVKLGKEVREYHLPRFYEPLKGSELKKEGYYSVEEDTLLKLKGGSKKLLDGILEIKKLQKDVNTYLRGLPNKQDEGNYDKNYIYGQFSQVTTRTGRLSSLKPNLQNLSDNALRHFTSRY